MTEQVQIAAQATPNPETLKFVVNRELLPKGSRDVRTKEAAQASPLAKALFEISEVRGVFIGTNFVTVTKAAEVTWSTLAKGCVQVLSTVLQKEKNPVGELAESAQAPGAEEESPQIKQIKEILDREIRPAVAADGGDIVFHDYKDGILTLHLQGACSQCPSAMMTLRMGVETRLKSLVPEIKEIVQI